jgi:hypothetical protein
MRNLITLTVLLSCGVLYCSAQRSQRDSLQYYNSQLTRLYDRVWDSLKLDDSARYYRQRIRRARERSRNYVAFTLFGGAENADYNTFNAAIAKDGFGGVHGPLTQFGGGSSFRGYNGIIIDLNYIVAGVGSSTANSTASIRTSSTETLNLQIGYAVINTGRFSFYPYVGFAERFSSLNYSTPDTANLNYNSIGSLLQGGKSVSTSSDVLCYQAGIGVDWLVHKIDNYQEGIILFAKFGTDGAFGHETYPIAGVSYDPGIRYGAWVAQLGFKFFFRS